MTAFSYCFFLLQGALGNTFYWLGDVRFPSVPLSRSFLEESLTEASLFLIEWQEMQRKCSHEEKSTDHTGVFFLVAKKTQWKQEGGNGETRGYLIFLVNFLLCWALYMLLHSQEYPNISATQLISMHASFAESRKKKGWKLKNGCLRRRDRRKHIWKGKRAQKLFRTREMNRSQGLRMSEEIRLQNIYLWTSDLIRHRISCHWDSPVSN